MKQILIAVLLAGMLVFLPGEKVFSADGTVKFAVVDVQKVFANYRETEKVRNYLQQAKDDRQSKLDQYQEEIRSLQEGYQKREKELSEEEKEKLQTELQAKLKTLEDRFQLFGMELKNIQKKKLGELEKSIRESIIEVGKREGYSIILEKEVVYLGGDDITEKVITYMNKEK